jgi:hypothetical protein
LHTCEFTKGFLIHIVEEKKWYCTLVSLFSIHIGEEKKQYCILMGPKVVFKKFI